LITVAIIAYGDEDVERVVKEVLSQKTDLKIDLIVVWDLPPKKSVGRVRKYCRVFVRRKRLGKSSAVKLAASKARGKVVFLVPADVFLSSNCIEEMTRVFMEDPRCGVVWAKPTPLNARQNLFTMCWSLIHELNNRVAEALDAVGALAFASGELIAVRKELALSIPNWIINDDSYIALTAARKGFKIRLSRVRVGNLAPTTFREYIAQRARWQYGNIQVKRVIGEAPTTFLASIRNPLVIREIIKFLLESPKRILTMFTSILLEAIVAIKTLKILKVQERLEEVWPIILTSKKGGGLVYLF